MASQCFSKESRLLKKKDFDNLRTEAKKLPLKSCLAFYKENLVNNNSKTRLGFSVSRKIGKANVRNRLKRLLRENFRTSDFKYLGKDLIVILNPRFFKNEALSFAEKEKQLLSDFKRVLGSLSQVK